LLQCLPTFCSLAKWRTLKNLLSILHCTSFENRMFNLALNPPFCQTAVGGWAYFL
jgi:hypothetical protein